MGLEKRIEQEVTGLQVVILCSRVEAGTGLHGVENVVTHDKGLGKLGMQAFEQLAHGLLLGFGTGVGRTPFGIQAALVADTDGMTVTVLAVSTDYLQRTPRLDGAVAKHHEMVAAAVLPPMGAMPAVDVLDVATLPRTHCRAVDDDEGNVSHFRERLKVK